MNPEQPSVADTPAYWTHKVDGYPSPVAITRMSQLIDFDPRVTETAKTVYRFLIGWYHREHGDALISQRHVAKVMKGRAPAGAACPSNSAVSRAIINLMETGWVARTVKGRGKAHKASRYVPVFNVLELASQGRFPEVAHRLGHFSDNDNWPTSWATSSETGPLSGPPDAETGPPAGPKNLIREPVTSEPVTRSDYIDITPVADGLSATAPDDGFGLLASAYAKSGDNLVAARDAFNDIAPDAAELSRMVRSAESWRKSATGNRMSLMRWLRERRWLTGSEFVKDNRPTFAWPACVVTWIKPRKDAEGEPGAIIKFRDRMGMLQTRVLNRHEFDDFQTQCKYDRPSTETPSEDLHEFVGVRFQILHDGEFGYYMPEAA